jgi:septal ring factor EnvC (AmiA/AmiB activator)
MNAYTALLVGLLALPLITFGACHWWYQRKLTEQQAQSQKLDKARQFTSEQVRQARKQIEKLQSEMAALQAKLAATQTNAARPRAAELPRAPESLDLTQALAAGDAQHAKRLPVDGFADTEPMTAP